MVDIALIMTLLDHRSLNSVFGTTIPLQAWAFLYLTLACHSHRLTPPNCALNAIIWSLSAAGSMSIWAWNMFAQEDTNTPRPLWAPKH